MNYYYLVINFFVGSVSLYIALKTKYLDFIIDPSSRFYKRNFKTYINNYYTDHKRNKSIKKNIDQINKEKENIVKKSQINDISSYKSVFYRLYSLIILSFLSGIINYFVVVYKLEIKSVYSILYLEWFIFSIILFVYFIRFLCYLFLDIYLFSGLFSNLFSIFLSLLYGAFFSCFYILEYKFYQISNCPLSYKILKYFILLYIILPLFLTFIIIFIVSFLYRNNKIKVNNKFHTFLKTLFIISFFIETSFVPQIFGHNSLFTLIIYLLEALFGLILYSLVWVNTLNQLDRFIEQKIPKKCEWLLVYFLFESLIFIFMEILLIIIHIRNYLVRKKKL